MAPPRDASGVGAHFFFSEVDKGVNKVISPDPFMGVISFILGKNTSMLVAWWYIFRSLQVVSATELTELLVYSVLAVTLRRRLHRCVAFIYIGAIFFFKLCFLLPWYAPASSTSLRITCYDS